jgi:hypothetical protein
VFGIRIFVGSWIRIRMTKADLDAVKKSTKVKEIVKAGTVTHKFN